MVERISASRIGAEHTAGEKTVEDVVDQRCVARTRTRREALVRELAREAATEKSHRFQDAPCSVRVAGCPAARRFESSIDRRCGWVCFDERIPTRSSRKIEAARTLDERPTLRPVVEHLKCDRWRL